MEFTLLWAALTAVALGWLGLRIWSERLPEHSFDLLLGAAVAGLVVGRLTTMLVQDVNPLTSPSEIIVIRGGVHTGAASLAFIAMVLCSTRASRGAMDALAPAILFALSGWHAGCLWREACLGTTSDLPWAWALDGSAATRHPVEIYTAFGLMLGAWAVSRLGWRFGRRAGAGLAVAAAVRLITEPLRPSITGGPVVWYMAGVAVGIIVAALGHTLSRSRAPT